MEPMNKTRQMRGGRMKGIMADRSAGIYMPPITSKIGGRALETPVAPSVLPPRHERRVFADKLSPGPVPPWADNSNDRIREQNNAVSKEARDLKAIRQRLDETLRSGARRKVGIENREPGVGDMVTLGERGKRHRSQMAALMGWAGDGSGDGGGGWAGGGVSVGSRGGRDERGGGGAWGGGRQGGASRGLRRQDLGSRGDDRGDDRDFNRQGMQGHFKKPPSRGGWSRGGGAQGGREVQEPPRLSLMREGANKRLGRFPGLNVLNVKGRGSRRQSIVAEEVEGGAGSRGFRGVSRKVRGTRSSAGGADKISNGPVILNNGLSGKKAGKARKGPSPSHTRTPSKNEPLHSKTPSKSGQKQFMEELERTVKMPLDPLRIFMQQYGDLAGAGVRHKASSKNNFENTTKQRPPASISLGRTLHARPSGHGLGGYGAGGVAVAMAAVEEQREAGQDEIYEDEYGGGMLSVGVADDPNPRFRSAMEDAYAIELGFGERRSLGRTGKLHSTGAGGGIHSVMKAPSDSGRKQATVHARSSANFDITHSSYGMSTTQSSIMPMANARGGFFAIYDGHGGRECADFAREHLHRELDKALRSHVESQKALEKAFLITDEKIRESGRFDECGSTAVVAYVHVDEREGRDLFLANVGDAQAFLVAEVTVADGSRRLLPVPLSYNHVATDAREVRRVREVGGSVMLGRVAGVLAVTRALGDHAYKRGGGLSAVPYQTHCRLGPQHKYLMMGCDGVWDVVQPEEAVAELEGLTDPEEMAQKLVELSLAKGTTDNTTALIVRF